VFRITKDNHNILQGVDKTGNVLDSVRAKKLDDWCEENATRYWTRKDGPLRPSSEGGAHVVIVDDPQLPMLVEIAKKQDPERPVIFRSHIQVRGDLCDTEGSPAAGVWNWIWNHVQKCDVFVSHPVPDFVPSNVPSKKVGYLPATTDWLDGLNKKMSIQDRQYYMHEFYMDILKQQHFNPSLKFKLQYPKRPYMVQIARFDPAKGIDDVIKSYAKFRTDYVAPAGWTSPQIPQLIIAGHGAVDDPDATIIYASTMSLIRTTYPQYEPDIIVMRVGPTDQILNALLRNAKIALQLSTREGFEVKVSEALHHGRPVIASNRGGIPLQVIRNFAGFVVDPDEPDYHAHVAKYMFHLFSDEEDRRAMSAYAKAHISDEVSTVGNALSWLYLADRLSGGERVEPDTRWINDMARDEAGFPVDVSETRLDRTLILKPGSSRAVPVRTQGERGEGVKADGVGG
jgi:glycosyltransferase involved in cell wall biosynthesis